MSQHNAEGNREWAETILADRTGRFSPETHDIARHIAYEAKGLACRLYDAAHPSAADDPHGFSNGTTPDITKVEYALRHGLITQVAYDLIIAGTPHHSLYAAE